MIDKFNHMWQQQLEFMKLLQQHRNFPNFPTDITSKQGQQFLESISFHCMKELFEAVQHLKNSKSHRLTEITDIDRDAYLEELVDAQHLLLEIALASGITEDEYFKAYMNKGLKNETRIKEGY